MPPIDPSRFVEALSPAMRQAASIARALEGRVPNQPKSAETTEVKRALTIADTAAQEALLVPLLENFPQVALEAEEDTESVAHFDQSGVARVVCDPIDGTLRSYLEARGPYSVMLGLEQDGRYEAALVALPREGLFFDAVRGHGARCCRAGSVSRRVTGSQSGRRVLVSNGMPAEVCDVLRAQGWEVVPASGGAVAVAPLIKGVRAGLRWGNAENGVSIRGRIGLLIAREAGLLVCGSDGEPFPDDQVSTAHALLVAGGAEDVDVLRDAIAQHPRA
jgi:fructose-1,6-bisphosphatase/inositol monophosphatase family enzyme